MFRGFLEESIVARAVKKGACTVNIIDLRDYAEGPYRKVDDKIYGGGPGMLMMCPPWFKAVEGRLNGAKSPSRVVMTSPAGRKFDQKAAEEIREKYRHPLWKAAGEIAKKVGGHGGMDFLMDIRWAYCLQNGLPLDTDVYDLATWSSLIDLTERSVKSGSRPVEFPDFTRGAWKTAKPVDIDGIDLAKMGIA